MEESGALRSSKTCILLCKCLLVLLGTHMPKQHIGGMQYECWNTYVTATVAPILVESGNRSMRNIGDLLTPLRP